MVVVTLYVKTHNITGLKYLGKTVKDPFKYKGSGKYWLRHLKEHGEDVSTEIIFQTDDLKWFEDVAIYYSILWNVVESNGWANLIVETGSGGDNPLAYTDEAKLKNKETRLRNKKVWKQTEESNLKRSLSHKGKKKSKESIEKSANARRGRKASEEACKNISRALKGKKRPMTEQHKANLKCHDNNKIQVTCPHCSKTGQKVTMAKFHFDRCQSNPDRLEEEFFLPICCIYCKFESKTIPNFYRYHGNNCKLKERLV